MGKIEREQLSPTLNSELDSIKSSILQNTQNIASLSNPNLLINGDFQVWQRGNSFNVLGNGVTYYTSDRWHIALALATSITVSKGSSGQLQIVNTTAFTSNARFGQFIEIPPSLRGKSLTLSINISSTVAQNLILFATSYDGTVLSQPPINFKIISLTNAISTYTLTFTAPTTSYLYIGLALACASSGYYGSTDSMTLSACTINIYWVKLEEGSIITPLVSRLYVEELMYCQKYYEVTSADEHFIGIFATTTGNLDFYFKYKIDKKSNPLVTFGHATDVGKLYLLAPNIAEVRTPSVEYINYKVCKFHMPTTSMGAMVAGQSVAAYGQIAIDGEIY